MGTAVSVLVFMVVVSLVGHLFGHKGAAGGMPCIFPHENEENNKAAPPGEGRHYPEE